MAQSHNENDTDRNLNCPGIRLDCGSLPKCYPPRPHGPPNATPLPHEASGCSPAGAARCLAVVEFQGIVLLCKVCLACRKSF